MKRSSHLGSLRWLRGLDFNQRAFGYEPNEVSGLLNPAAFSAGLEPASLASEASALPLGYENMWRPLLDSNQECKFRRLT